MNVQQYFAAAILLSAAPVKAIIDPTTLYTPTVTIVQSAQNSVVLQNLVASSTIPAVINIQMPAATTTEGGPTPLTPNSIGSSGTSLAGNSNFIVSAPVSYTGTTSPIIVAHSNIVIDLNGQTIAYSKTPGSTIINGIMINPGCSNITIKNGTIAGFPGSGIYAAGTTQNPIGHITIDSITIRSCYQGITISSADNITITNSQMIGNSNLSGPTSGISFANCSTLSLSNDNVLNTNSPKGECCGFSFTECQKTSLTNCIAQGNTGTGLTIGFMFSHMINDNYFENCTSNGNWSSNAEALGFLAKYSNFTSLKNCHAICNYSNSKNNDSHGLCFINSSMCMVMKNTVMCNDYGIFDLEEAGNNTNLFTQNVAANNTIADYFRVNGPPFPFISVNQEFLQGILQTGSLDNISIIVNPTNSSYFVNHSYTANP